MVGQVVLCCSQLVKESEACKETAASEESLGTTTHGQTGEAFY